MRNLWNRELGTRQGRIKPASAPAIAGEHVFCLGYDGPGNMADVSPGDFALIEQHATFTPGTKLLRIRARIRPPAIVPAGHRWILEILLDDEVMVVHPLVAGGPWRDRLFSLNVSKVSPGKHFVTMQLRFVPNSIHQVISMASFECGPPEDTVVTFPGIESAETFGDAYVAFGVPIFVSGIPSGEAFGDHQAKFAPQPITDAGNIASGQAFGTALLRVEIDGITGVATAEAFGSPLPLTPQAILGSKLGYYFEAYTFGNWDETVRNADATVPGGSGTPGVGSTSRGLSGPFINADDRKLTFTSVTLGSSPPSALIFGLFNMSNTPTSSTKVLFRAVNGAVTLEIQATTSKFIQVVPVNGGSTANAVSNSALPHGSSSNAANWTSIIVHIKSSAGAGASTIELYINGTLQTTQGNVGAGGSAALIATMASAGKTVTFSNNGSGDGYTLARWGMAHHTSNFSATEIANLHTALNGMK